MKPIYPNRPTRGHSLMELMVGMGLMLLLMGSLVSIFQAGSRYFINSNKVVELQQACLMGANAIGGEICETNLNCVKDEDPTHRYVVFTSPKTDQNTVQFASSKKILWQKFICYFVDDVLPETALRRQIQYINPPKDEPPQPTSGMDLNYFRNLGKPQAPGASRRIASHIYFLQVVRDTSISVTIGARDPYREFHVKVETRLQARN